MWIFFGLIQARYMAKRDLKTIFYGNFFSFPIGTGKNDIISNFCMYFSSFLKISRFLKFFIILNNYLKAVQKPKIEPGSLQNINLILAPKKWLKYPQYGIFGAYYYWIQTRSNSRKLAQTRTNSSKLVQTCSNLFKLVQTRSNSHKYDFFGHIISRKNFSDKIYLVNFGFLVIWDSLEAI